MEYLLKSAGIIAMFWLFYKIFLQKETFYNTHRLYFLAGIATAFLLPFYVIYSYMEIPAATLINVAETGVAKIVPTAGVTEKIQSTFDLRLLLIYIYAGGAVLLSVKFLFELISLIKFFKNTRKIRKKEYFLHITPEKIWPFSFFNRIVVPENLLNSSDFEKILAHEKVHVKHRHSIDMLIIRLVSIIQWFNPFVWWYKRDMEQNLEFIADNFAQKEIRNLKEYQYLLLKTGTGKSLFALTNNYFNTNLKKRIIMLQKEKSQQINRIKYVFILPVLVLFLYSFNTEKVYQIASEKPVKTRAKLGTYTPEFIVPNDTRIYAFNKNSTDEELNSIAKKLEKESGVSVKINVSRNKDNEIMTYIFATKYPGENEFEDKYVYGKKDKGIEETYIKTAENKSFEIWNNKIKVIISKDKTYTMIIDETEKTDATKEIIVESDAELHPLYIINGKKFKEPNDLIEQVLSKPVQSIHVYKGEEAVNKFGKDAQDGVIVIKTHTDEQDTGGRVSYNGTSYFYAIWINGKEKRITIYDRFGNKIPKNLAEKVYVKLRKEQDIPTDTNLYYGVDILKGEKINYDNKDYFYTIRNKQLIIFGKGGETPDKNIQKKIRKTLIRQGKITKEIKL